jgi:hypothetical protein
MNIPKLSSYLNRLSISGDLDQAELVRTVIETAPQSNYQSYVAQLTAADGGVMQATVLYNDIPGTLTWTGFTAGSATLTSSTGVFKQGKTFIMFNKSFYNTLFNTNTQVVDAKAYRNSDTQIKLDVNGTTTDIISDCSIEIRIYS